MSNATNRRARTWYGASAAEGDSRDALALAAFLLVAFLVPLLALWLRLRVLGTSSPREVPEVERGADER